LNIIEKRWPSATPAKIAFQRVNVDDVVAVSERRGAGAADEILDAGIGEDIRQLLFGHPQRLDAEEPVEKPRDIFLG
jgi:hypothetical protein